LAAFLNDSNVGVPLAGSIISSSRLSIACVASSLQRGTLHSMD
jgi:hypothetical protein